MGQRLCDLLDGAESLDLLPGLNNDDSQSDRWVLLHEVFVGEARLQHDESALRQTVPLDLAVFSDGKADLVIHTWVFTMHELKTGLALLIDCSEVLKVELSRLFL